MIIGYRLTQELLSRASLQSRLLRPTPMSQIRMMTMRQAASELQIDIHASKHEIEAAYKARAKKYHPANKVRTIRYQHYSNSTTSFSGSFPLHHCI